VIQGTYADVFVKVLVFLNRQQDKYWLTAAKLTLDVQWLSQDGAMRHVRQNVVKEGARVQSTNPPPECLQRRLRDFSGRLSIAILSNSD
jgi:hypothetical protein